MTRDGLTNMQSTILDRILDGSATSPASNAIPTILDGLVEPADMPDAQSVRQWIDPRTGETCRFCLQHAVDYAFVVDGDQSAPTSLRLSVGPSFCRAPLHLDHGNRLDTHRARASSIPRSTTPMQRADSIISLFAQEEPSTPVLTATTRRPVPQHAHQDSTVVEVGSNSADIMPAPSLAFPAAPAGDSVPIQPSNQPPSLDARIMEQLLNQPELLARVVQGISTSRAKRPATSLPEAEPVRRTSKYSFTPTVVQTAVHEGITAPEHRGKAPSVFVETVVYAAAVRFQPHPVVIIRLYDFQFGMFGLSILHFVPFGVHRRMAWLNGGGVNMQNFSAGVTAPRPSAASSMGELVDAARMLCRYGQEFFTQPVRDVLESLLDFVQQLDGWHSWMAADLPHLVFWINSVLENNFGLLFT
ncbi:hypothetical protein V7S43_012299 [Phytophthora oleae]|uniref:Uncharacterized protein n=1 Tax=Phytophthora oleae TaxID=2107226 RepID=A0ABD3FA90_9STRA